HGIGGGKYDEVTDALIRHFYGAAPPGFLILSGTLLLPFPMYPARDEDRARLARLLRDLEFNPQRHLDPQALADPASRQAVADKERWVEERPATRRGRRERFRELRRVTEALVPAVAGQRDGATSALARCEAGLRANALLRRRDYAFCLYPESALRPFT